MTRKTARELSHRREAANPSDNHLGDPPDDSIRDLDVNEDSGEDVRGGRKDATIVLIDYSG